MKGLKYLIELKDKISGPLDRIKAKAGAAVPALDRLKAKVVSFGVSAGNVAMGGVRKLTVGVGAMASRMASAALVAGTLAIGALVGLGSQSTRTALDMQNAERIINFATGGQGAENIQFLDKTIRDLNLPLQETYSSFSQVAGAFKDTKLQGQGARDIFEGVATAASAMSLGTERSNRVFLALSQMMSKGKISADEMTQQLGEALPGSLGIAARSMGMTKEGFYKMMEQGKIMSEDFLPKFAKELKKTFGEEAVRAAQTPAAAFQMWRNSVDKVKNELGKNLLPVLAELARKFAPTMENAAEKIGPIFEMIFTGINNWYNAMLPIFSALYSVWTQIREPLFVFLTALYDVSNVFRSVFAEGIGSMLSAIDFAGILGGAFMALLPLLDAIKQGYEAARPLLSLLGKVAGFIINVIGKVVVKVLELVSWWLTKWVKMITWLYEKVADFLGFLGVIEKKKVNVKVGVDKPADLFAGLRPKDQKLGFSSAGSGTGLGFDPEGSNGSGSGGSSSKSIDSVTRGGSRPTNININLGSLISGGFTVQTTNLKEGAKDVERVVIEQLMRVLNGANQLATD